MLLSLIDLCREFEGRRLSEGRETDQVAADDQLLDFGCAVGNRQHARVAEMKLYRELATEPVGAVDLDRTRGDSAT